MPIPAGPSAARDKYLLDQVAAGNYYVPWAEVAHTTGGRSIQLNVFGDALIIDEVRVSASAEVAQKMADLLGCLLLTCQIADLMFAQRKVTLRPFTHTPDNTMGSTAVMVQYSQQIQDAINAAGGQPQDGLVQTVGKHWCLSTKISAAKACNYGWHVINGGGYAPATSLAGPGVKVLQPESWTHNPQHVDYSQIVQLVHRTCWVDGQEMDLADVLQSAALVGLVSAEGIVPVRQPGVGETSPTTVPPHGQPPKPGSPPGVATTSEDDLFAQVLDLAPWVAGLWALFQLAQRTGALASFARFVSGLRPGRRR